MTQKTQLQNIRSRPHPSPRASDNSSSLNSGPWDKKILEDLKSLATQVSCWVMSNSLQPMDYTVHGILQARILEWVAVLFIRGSSQPRDWTQVSHIACGFFTSWAARKAQPNYRPNGMSVNWVNWKWLARPTRPGWHVNLGAPGRNLHLWLRPHLPCCFLKNFILLKSSWFTMLCWFLLYSKVTQLYIYIYIYFFTWFSIMVYHRILNIVPCAI